MQNLSFVTSALPEILRGPKIWKLGHVTRVTPPFHNFWFFGSVSLTINLLAKFEVCIFSHSRGSQNLKVGHVSQATLPCDLILSFWISTSCSPVELQISSWLDLGLRTRDRQQGLCVQSQSTKVGHAWYHVRVAKLVCKLASGQCGGENNYSCRRIEVLLVFFLSKCRKIAVMAFVRTQQLIHLHVFWFPTHHDPDRRKLGLAYGLCDVNVRRLMVPAGSRRQKSSRADIMSVVCTVHFASG